VVYFFWQAVEGLEVGFFLFPHLPVLAVLGLVAAVSAAFRGPKLTRGKWVWLNLPFLMPAAILAYGLAFKYSGPGSAPAWRSQVIDVLVGSHVPIGLVLLVVCRRNPLVPIGLTGFQMWLSFSMGCVSYMFVTNKWL
jgi:hypothetical protein